MHHELSTSSNDRNDKQVIQLLEIIRSHVDPFTTDDDGLTNIISHTKMPADIVTDMMKLTAEGQNAYSKFVHERLVSGEKSFWAPLKRMNLKTFKHWHKLQSSDSTKADKIRSERNLFARCLVVTRSRPELDIRDIFGHYELTPHPRSVFDATGQLLPAVDKCKLMHILESITPPSPENMQVEQDRWDCVIIDGMAILHQIQNPHQSCAHLAESFCQRVQHLSINATEVHVLFDRYDRTLSLKHHTRERRKATTKSIHIQIGDATPLHKVQMKQLLAEPRNKDQLTEYLFRKVVTHFGCGPATIIASYRDSVISNRGNYDHLASSQEEADTKIILHASDAAKRQLSSLCVYSADTDVLVLLTAKFHSLPQTAVMETGRRRVNIGDLFAKLGFRKSESLIGFHAITGCDQTGRFAGKGKPTAWATFMEASDATQNAFFQLGREEVLTDQVLDGLETFVSGLYQGKRSTTILKLR